ncbi:RNA-directed DNA polymerase (reverse transcriptase)-related family protein [Rhynchospora pubera]|uniref:RNA-directed DNA polymerase (Reverse transcriptase)-related family protein n=1 Tax=Rhynchospora pubera TaxID=906938 RepID=A0AAV8CCU5_9POAL|nr:RNA-directed DNA polymerase (reverse transcriptase)-related family protein [Rhynchospora pubera]
MLNAHPGDDSHMYLGVPVVASRPVHFTKLVDKVHAKLNSWSAKMLSQAGKVTLLKTVIEPMVLYGAVGGTMPESIVSALNKKVRGFFWENNGKKRMHLVNWSTITKPKLEGGLGLRDMAVINRAAAMKILWKLAYNEFDNQPWIKILKAKYLVRKSLWLSSTGPSCTKLWRAVMAMRGVLRDNVRWQLGSGDKCHVFGEPWHHFWQHFKPLNGQQRGMMVHDLIDSATGTWLTGRLTDCLGFYGALYIATQFPSPATNMHRPDRLVFLPAQNGAFTFKRAVNLLSATTPQLNEHERNTLKTIWYNQALMPRVKLFLWKLFHNSVPTIGTYASKMKSTQVPCQLCDSGVDDGVHALFKCSSARAFWLASPLGVHSDALPDDPRQLLQAVVGALHGSDFSSFANHVWALWKHRCAVLYGGKVFKVESGLSMARGFSFLSFLTGNFKITSTVRDALGHWSLEPTDAGLKCWIDGSYDNSGDGGWAFLIQQNQTLVMFGTGFGSVSSPFRAELQALQLAMRAMARGMLQDCVIYSDCQVLCRLLNGENIFDAVPWQCFFQV